MSLQREIAGRNHESYRRRPRSTLGRRLAFAVVLAGAMAGLCGAGVAGAVTVVNATVEGGGASGGLQSVTDAELVQAGCPQWGQATKGAGATAIGLYLNGQLKESVDIPPATWELGTVLTCGLNVPTSGLVVLVQRSDRSYAQLSWTDLTQTSEYTSDPQSSGSVELPVVGVNGAGVEYLRPWLGGQDDNWTDSMPDPGGALNLELFENGSQPLVVTITTSMSGQTVTFGASAPGVPSAQLSCKNWDFGDGRASPTGTSPQHTYTSYGNFDVVTQCSDTATGQTGPGYVLVHVPTPGAGCGSCTTSSTPNPGPTGGPPSGPTNSHGSNPGSAPGNHQHHTGAAKAAHRHRSSSTVPHHRTSPEKKIPTAAAGTAGLLALGNSAGGAGTPSIPRSDAGTTANAAHNTGKQNPARKSTRVVSGRLIGSVTPLSPDRSPLVHVLAAQQPTAPAVRGSAAITALGGVVGGLAVVVLLVLGAGRELSWRGGWRALRLGN